MTEGPSPSEMMFGYSTIPVEAAEKVLQRVFQEDLPEDFLANLKAKLYGKVIDDKGAPTLDLAVLCEDCVYCWLEVDHRLNEMLLNAVQESDDNSDGMVSFEEYKSIVQKLGATDSRLQRKIWRKSLNWDKSGSS
eukprot:gene24114-29265_t